jgi:hypothetical protein
LKDRRSATVRRLVDASCNWERIERLGESRGGGRFKACRFRLQLGKN